LNIDRLNKQLTLVANIAILGGLVFLALEIQQNTNAVRSTAVQAATIVAREHLLMMVQNPDVNRLAMADYSSLSEEDQRRRFWLARSFWLGMQGLYRQRQLGVFPEAEWEVWKRIICANYERSELWAPNAATLASDFVRFVENCESGVGGILPK